MTTTVIVHAHCASDKEVIIEMDDIESGETLKSQTLQDGETWQDVVFDNRIVSVSEHKKVQM